VPSLLGHGYPPAGTGSGHVTPGATVRVRPGRLRADPVRRPASDRARAGVAACRGAPPGRV